MRLMTAAGLVLILGSACLSQADPLSIANLPADTRWVIHADVDAIRGTPLAELVRTRIVEPRKEEINLGLAQLERVTGMRLASDCHDIALYGSSYAQGAACIIIHAPMNEERVVSFLKLNPEFKSTPHNGHEVYQWQDKGKGKLMCGAFARTGWSVLSEDQSAVEAALDVMDGKAPSLKPDSPLTPVDNSQSALAPSPSPPFRPALYIAGDQLNDLPRAQKTDSPILGQLDAGQLYLGVIDQDVRARVILKAASEQAATQMTTLAEGIKAMVQLAAADNRAPARTRLVAAALSNLTTTAEGKIVRTEWSLSKDKLDALAEMMEQPNGATTAHSLP